MGYGDELVLTGPYAQVVTLGPATVTGIERITAMTGSAVRLILDAQTLATASDLERHVRRGHLFVR